MFEAIEDAVSKCLREKPVDHMMDEEITKSVLAALPTTSIRQHHGPVLNQSIQMLLEDARYKGDALTASFPPSSRQLDPLVNEAFGKIVLGIIVRVYNANSQLSEENQPHIFKRKEHVQANAMDRVNRVVSVVTRNVLLDPRCKTRRPLAILLLYFFLKKAGTIKLLEPPGDKPAANKGSNAALYAVQV